LIFEAAAKKKMCSCLSPSRGRGKTATAVNGYITFGFAMPCIKRDEELDGDFGFGHNQRSLGWMA
jgi:hypothetical protein